MYTQWIENCVVQRVSVRDGLVLDLDDYNEIVISCPLLLTLPAFDRYPVEAVRIDPLKIATDERPLLNLAGAVCTQAWSGDDGGLHLRFSRGHSIDVDPPIPRKRHGSCTASATATWHAYPPGGRVRVVRHDLPPDSDDANIVNNAAQLSAGVGATDALNATADGGRVNFGGNAWIRLNVDRTALATSRRASIPE